MPMYSSAALAVSTSFAFTRWILFCGSIVSSQRASASKAKASLCTAAAAMRAAAQRSATPPPPNPHPSQGQLPATYPTHRTCSCAATASSTAFCTSSSVITSLGAVPSSAAAGCSCAAAALGSALAPVAFGVAGSAPAPTGCCCCAAPPAAGLPPAGLASSAAAIAAAEAISSASRSAWRVQGRGETRVAHARAWGSVPAPLGALRDPAHPRTPVYTAPSPLVAATARPYEPASLKRWLACSAAPPFYHDHFLVPVAPARGPLWSAAACRVSPPMPQPAPAAALSSHRLVCLGAATVPRRHARLAGRHLLLLGTLSVLRMCGGAAAGTRTTLALCILTLWQLIELLTQ